VGHSSTSPRAFSLIELVMVVAIIGIIAAIAVPRLASASERARQRQVEANAAILQRAVDLYAAEHAERTPAHRPDGSVSDDALEFIRRLMGKTSDTGALSPTGLFGPYLKSWPRNPYTICRLIRIDGPDGAKNCAWRFHSASGRITPDHTGILEPCGMDHGDAAPLMPSPLSDDDG
jgi:prepilin-type N-terminal cleavage/methylation domain-containing protein